MKIKKSFLLLLSMVSLTAAIHAQDSSGVKKMPPMRQHKMEMLQELNLSDDQKAKLKKLRGEEKVKIDSIQSSTVIPDDQKQEQIKTVRKSGRKAMDDLLTPEQKSKMMQMRSGQMDKKKSGKQPADSTE